MTALHYTKDYPDYRHVEIVTLSHSDNPRERYPLLHPVMAEPNAFHAVPIRFTTVFIQDRTSVSHKFIIAFRHQPSSGQNFALYGVEKAVKFEGELVVMAGGAHFNIVNFQDGNAKEVAVVAVRQFVSYLAISFVSHHECVFFSFLLAVAIEINAAQAGGLRREVDYPVYLHHSMRSRYPHCEFSSDLVS